MIFRKKYGHRHQVRFDKKKILAMRLKEFDYEMNKCIWKQTTLKDFIYSVSCMSKNFRTNIFPTSIKYCPWCGKVVKEYGKVSREKGITNRNY